MIKINTILHAILYHCVVAIFFLSGAITMYSISKCPFGLGINIIMGGIFMMIGLYYYAKAKSVNALILMVEDSSELKQRKLHYSIKFLLYENLMLLISLLVSIVMFSGIIYRVFGENKAVFG